jgi:hypothetical protein
MIGGRVHGKTEYRRRRYFHFQHIPRATHNEYPRPSFGFGALYTYFPCAELPTDPAIRFADLFLTRERWKAEHIKPYLSDIAVDAEDLDKLLLKYARALTDKDGSWYMARAR